MNRLEMPEALIITVSQAQLKERGLRNWVRNFYEAMNAPDDNPHVYCFRVGSRPRHEVQSVYICIMGRIAYKCNFVEYRGSGTIRFDDGRELYGHTWIICSAPMIKAPYKIPRKGFQGFRYTDELF